MRPSSFESTLHSYNVVILLTGVQNMCYYSTIVSRWHSLGFDVGPDDVIKQYNMRSDETPSSLCVTLRRGLVALR